MKFAIIGATGNVGRKTIDLLEKSNLNVDELFLVASKKSAGQKIKFKSQKLSSNQFRSDLHRNRKPY